MISILESESIYPFEKKEKKKKREAAVGATNPIYRSALMSDL